MTIAATPQPIMGLHRKIEVARAAREARDKAGPLTGETLIDGIGSWVSIPFQDDGAFIDLLHPSGLDGPEVFVEPHRLDRPAAPAGWTYTEFSQITGSQPFGVRGGALKGRTVRLVHVHTPDFTKLTISGNVVLTWVTAIVDDHDQLIGQINFTIRKVTGGLYQTNRMQHPGSVDSAAPLKLERVADLKSKMKGWLTKGLLEITFP